MAQASILYDGLLHKTWDSQAIGPGRILSPFQANHLRRIMPVGYFKSAIWKEILHSFRLLNVKFVMNCQKGQGVFSIETALNSE